MRAISARVGASDVFGVELVVRRLAGSDRAMCEWWGGARVELTRRHALVRRLTKDGFVARRCTALVSPARIFAMHLDGARMLTRVLPVFATLVAHSVLGFVCLGARIFVVHAARASVVALETLGVFAVRNWSTAFVRQTRIGTRDRVRLAHRLAVSLVVDRHTLTAEAVLWGVEDGARIFVRWTHILALRRAKACPHASKANWTICLLARVDAFRLAFLHNALGVVRFVLSVRTFIVLASIDALVTLRFVK